LANVSKVDITTEKLEAVARLGGDRAEVNPAGSPNGMAVYDNGLITEQQISATARLVGKMRGVGYRWVNK